MNVMQLIVGLAALIFGRKLFWLFMGVVGFAAGIDVTARFLAGMPQWSISLVAVLAGIAGALLALFFQRLAIVVAGFVGGGYVLMNALNLSGWQAPPLSWLLFVIGGIIGALLLYFLFDWTLIFLSSVVGASLMIRAIPMNPAITGVLFLGLFITGFLIQAKMMGRRNRR